MPIKINRYDNGVFEENTYVIRETERNVAAVIDPGEFSKEIQNVIDSTNGLRYIFLTHAHSDHMRDADEYMKRWPDAKLVVHKDDAEMLENASINYSQETVGKKIELKPDICVEDKDKLDFGAETVKIIHTPGHSSGGMCLLIDGKLFSGDTLFYRSVGRTDLYGGDWDALKKSVKNKLYALPDETEVYPGHGPATKIGDEKRSNPYV